mgnify:CR=1 FL=1
MKTVGSDELSAQESDVGDSQRTLVAAADGEFRDTIIAMKKKTERRVSFAKMNQNIIEISHLSKTYKDGTVALEDINLNITDGEIIALLGPNGAGKTTLISAICGITNISSGKVTVGGYDVVENYKKTRALIGLVPQEIALQPFEKVIDVVRYSRNLFGCANDDAHIEWLGGNNSGYLRISTSDDSGTEYIQFGDYDNVNRGGTFTQWLRISRSTGTFTGTFSATTFSGSGASLTSLNASNISSGTINAARVPTLNQNTTGSAATLTTARTIGGVSFNGSANINLPGVNIDGNQNTSGNAGSATVLETTRNFSISGEITANAQSFNGSGNVTLSATVDDNIIDEANLKISNSPQNGFFLKCNTGVSGGLTWSEVTLPTAATLDGTTLASGITASSITSLGTLTGLNVNGTLNVQNGNVLQFGTSTNNNIRGEIGATETNDRHLIIATSGGEDIAFRDGGLGGTTNMVIRGDGNVLINNGNLLCSGTASVANTLTVTGSEGTDSIIELLADDGDDNEDKWRIRSDATGNDLKFESYYSGSWSDGSPLKLAGNGIVTIPGQAIIDKVNINNNQ